MSCTWCLQNVLNGNEVVVPPGQTNEGGGKFETQRAEVNEPNFPIIVESNFGGSATATVTISS